MITGYNQSLGIGQDQNICHCYGDVIHYSNQLSTDILIMLQNLNASNGLYDLQFKYVYSEHGIENEHCNNTMYVTLSLSL